jgi:tetratricopeptide (TPR) repeat protein
VTRRSATRGGLAALIVLIPAVVCAQGIAAWNFEAPNPKDRGFAGNTALGSAATGPGVGNPLGFKESTPPVVGLPKAHVDPKLEYAKGFTDVNLGRFGKAEEDFETALSVDPRNPKTLFMLGEARIGQGDLKGAAEAFEKALQYDPQQITIRTEYAVALARTGRLDQAQAQLSILQARANACGSSCREAGDLKAALARVQGVLAESPRENT